MKFADLHIHTNCSDGTYTPEEAVRLSSECDLSSIAITDHDTMHAIGPALKAGENFSLEVIPGIELSAEIDQQEIHILGYFIDWRAKWFQDKLSDIRKQRQRRALAIVEKLAQQGIDLNIAELIDRGDSEAIGRLHIAKMLVERGFVDSIREAFERYLANGRPCYVKKFKLSPVQAIDIIKELGGLAVLAHPFVIESDKLIAEFVSQGLRGIEVYYPEHNQLRVKQYLDLAKKYRLLVTGGSDCHGLGKQKAELGSIKLPYSYVLEMKKELGVTSIEGK